MSGNQVMSQGNLTANPQLLRPVRNSKRWQHNGNRQTARCRTNAGDGDAVTADPEAKFKRYGAHFGAKYHIDLHEFMGAVPRVRLRHSTDRQMSQLADLALLNERLAGNESWEIRQKLEHLKSKRKNWEFIYEYVTKLDATATLARIEEANMKVIHARRKCSPPCRFCDVLTAPTCPHLQQCNSQSFSLHSKATMLIGVLSLAGSAAA